MNVAQKGLRSRFEQFVTTLDGHENIDALLKDVPTDGKKRADYLFSGRTVIVEQKTLEVDPSEKPQKFMDELIKQRGLRFYGTVSSDQIFSKLPDGPWLKETMIQKITAQIDTDVARADKQTRGTRDIFNIPDAMGVLVILNENAKILTPDMVRYRVHNALAKRAADGALRYPHNMGAIIFSEIHSLKDADGTKLFPIVPLLWEDHVHARRFNVFSQGLLRRWAAFNGLPLRLASHEYVEAVQ